MLPVHASVYAATAPKYLLNLARSNMILVRVLLILTIILTGCGVSELSAFDKNSNATRMSTRKFETSTREKR